jgi:hypothetical protein
MPACAVDVNVYESRDDSLPIRVDDSRASRRSKSLAASDERDDPVFNKQGCVIDFFERREYARGMKKNRGHG